MDKPNKTSFNNFENIKMQHLHNQMNLNTLNKPANGTSDKFSEVRLKLGVIDNYLIKRNDDKIDPLDGDHIVNMNNGHVVIKWIDYNGGILRPEQFGYPNEGYPEPWSYFPEKDSKYPETRTLNCYNHDKASDKEMIPLTHSFIWSNGENWAGINYLPPIGTIVIIGYRKNGLPVILGTVQSNYKACKPYLKLGETMIKGYGNNYTHWRWSNKLDTHVWAEKDTIDIDDPNKQDKYPHNIDMWFRYDCYTCNMWLEVFQHGPNDENIKTTMEIKPESININSTHIDRQKSSQLTITTDNISCSSIDINTGDNTNMFMDPNIINVEAISNSGDKSTNIITPNSIKFNTTGDMHINADGQINIQGSKINLN